MTSKNLNYFLSIFLIILLLLCAYWVYSFGLSGGFIFDDYHSLKKLAIFGGEFNIKHSYEYLQSSDTGTLKRPISIFSFLIDAQNWPAEAYNFKRTNILIHLVNGLLLYVLLRLIFSHTKTNKYNPNIIAFLATGMWVLHPFLVSTTLYVVQRMAMLPLTFMLVGFIFYTWGRIHYEDKENNFNRLIIVLAVFGGTLFAMFSKENGVLFLLFCALYEVLIMQKFLNLTKLGRIFSCFLYYIPITIFIIFFLLILPNLLDGYQYREFTIYERLLTQFRVISDYLYHLYLPNYFTMGVFTDGYEISLGLFKPLTTLLSVVFILGLMTMAWVLRNRYVWFSFALLFFFLAHSIESTILPLEMYYEHRNYVASIFLAVPLAIYLNDITLKTKLFYIIPIAILILLSFLTLLRASMWGNNLSLHEMTMKKYPDSIRARTMTADIYERMGFYNEAIDIFSEGIRINNELRYQLNRISLMCSYNRQKSREYDDYLSHFANSLSSSKITYDDVPPLMAVLKKITIGGCKQDKNMASIILRALVENNLFVNGVLKSRVLKVYRLYVYSIYNDYENINNLSRVLISHKAYDPVFDVIMYISHNNIAEAEGLLAVLINNYNSDDANQKNESVKNRIDAIQNELYLNQK